LPWYSWNIAESGIKHQKSINQSFYIQHSIDSILFFFGHFDIFPLILPSNIFSIKELLLMLEITCQREVKHMMLPMKTITSVLKVSTDIITRITAHPSLAAILVIMCLDLQNCLILSYFFLDLYTLHMNITSFQYLFCYIFSLYRRIRTPVRNSTCMVGLYKIPLKCITSRKCLSIQWNSYLSVVPFSVYVF